MKPILLLLVSAKLIFAQDTEAEEAINSIFSQDFLKNYEEVTPEPLRSIGALAKCGEQEQGNQFVCVPYYNCNPTTNTVEVNPDLDGANKIDIRMQDDPECEHYLEKCCRIGNATDDTSLRTVSSTTTPSVDVREDATTPQSQRITLNTTQAFCGIRNQEGLDFNLVGGTNEANFGEFPWMLAILRKNPASNEALSVCGGSLIGPNVVLTGAHCVHNINIADLKVRAGEWDTQTTNERIPYQERNITQKITHNHFLKSNLYNDVALLILDRPFTKTDSVGTVCLPEQNQHFNSNECFATGWGKNIFGQKGQYAVILKKIQLPLVQNADCQPALRKTRLGPSFVLHRSFICAGGEANVDTCTGDGGSPLVCPDPGRPGRYLQVGIVAWGIGCGENQVPGVYVDVANFRNWIDNSLAEIGIRRVSYIA